LRVGVGGRTTDYGTTDYGTTGIGGEKERTKEKQKAESRKWKPEDGRLRTVDGGRCAGGQLRMNIEP
jgi:hypothetical protein